MESDNISKSVLVFSLVIEILNILLPNATSSASASQSRESEKSDSLTANQNQTIHDKEQHSLYSSHQLSLLRTSINPKTTAKKVSQAKKLVTDHQISYSRHHLSLYETVKPHEAVPPLVAHTETVNLNRVSIPSQPSPLNAFEDRNVAVPFMNANIPEESGTIIQSFDSIKSNNSGSVGRVLDPNNNDVWRTEVQSSPPIESKEQGLSLSVSDSNDLNASLQALDPNESKAFEIIENQGNEASDANLIDFEKEIHIPVGEDMGQWVPEIIGFSIRGLTMLDRLNLDGCDSLVDENNLESRLVPLLRILRAFRFPYGQDTGYITFTPEGLSEVKLDVKTRQIIIDGVARDLFYKEAKSEITLKPDIYVRPVDLAEILDMEIVWNEDLYQYEVQVNRALTIWRREYGADYSRKTELIEIEFPEVLPPSDFSTNLVQMVDVQFSPRFTLREEGSPKKSMDLSSPRETVYGVIKGGHFQMRLSHPLVSWDDRQDEIYVRNDDSYIGRIDSFEWKRRLPMSEISLGDSSFGLAELVMPTARLTGVRISGLGGYSNEWLPFAPDDFGVNQAFDRPEVFEGSAPLGSKVELFINDRLLDVQEPIEEEFSPQGFGQYRFEGIILAGGVLNEILIVITTPDGEEIRIPKTVIGTRKLLPKGRSAYMGVLGTNRTMPQDNLKGVETGDFSGHIAAGRFLYGLSDNVTIGLLAGDQEGMHERFIQQTNHGGGDRSYAMNSLHFGSTFSALMLNKILVTGEFAKSQGQGYSQYNGLAFRTRGEYLPTDKLGIYADHINLGTDFYDGQSPYLHDKRASEFGLSWKYGRGLSLEAGFGQIRNNLDGHLLDTTRVNYQTLGISTSYLKNVNLELLSSRLSSNTQEESPFLTEFRLRTSLLGINFSGQIALGDQIKLDGTGNFWTGLRLRRIPRLQSPGFRVSARKRLTRSNSLGFSYSETEQTRSWSLGSGFLSEMNGQRLSMSTGLIADLASPNQKAQLGLTNSVSLLLDEVGQNSLKLNTQYKNQEYQATLQLACRSLFVANRGKTRNVINNRIRPSNGSVHGFVFVDLNNNMIYDKGEPGVSDVEVHLNGKRAAVTDKSGYYIFSNNGRDSSARVHLNVNTIPAIYTVTNGNQIARTMTNTLTEVNLSLVPFVSIIGNIMYETPEEPQPAQGIRVILKNLKSGLFQADSFSASDGSYYFGEIIPGQYSIEIDTKSLTNQNKTTDLSKTIDIVATEEEWIEIQGPDFILMSKETKQEEVDANSTGDNVADEHKDPLPTSTLNKSGVQHKNKEHKQDNEDIWGDWF